MRYPLFYLLLPLRCSACQQQVFSRAEWGQKKSPKWFAILSTVLRQHICENSEWICQPSHRTNQAKCRMWNQIGIWFHLSCDEDIKNREDWITSSSSWYIVPYWNTSSTENLLSWFPKRCWAQRNKLEERNLSASAIFWILLALECTKALYVLSASRSMYI